MATSIDRAAVDRWLDDYVDAWKTYERDAIGALFADDVEYRYHPYDEPIRGRDAVLESWLGEGDHPMRPPPTSRTPTTPSTARSRSTGTSRWPSAPAATAR